MNDNAYFEKEKSRNRFNSVPSAVFMTCNIFISTKKKKIFK